ncbi:MAG: redoxin domain-containing protein [candidate division Zixibacteria bacterium]|nr:redoxin domain-containing protein [candidate division Zixibacteria bacterium]
MSSKAATDTTGYRLLIGQQFPNVEVLDLDGNVTKTSQILGQGRVFLFLEPTCSYCVKIIDRWRDQFEKKLMSPEEVAAIVPASVEAAQAYQRLQSLPFAVYVDTGLIFMNRFQVTDFPLQLVVGKSGTIHDYNFQVDRQIFADQIRRQFEK